MIVLSGQNLEIPPRLFQFLLLESKPEMSGLMEDQVKNLMETQVWFGEDLSTGAIADVFQVARYCIEHHDYVQWLFYLGLYAEKKALSLGTFGKPEEGLAILVDILHLELLALPHCDPQMARRISDALTHHAEAGVRLCGLFGSVGILSTHSEDVAALLGVLATIWEPELAEVLRGIEAVLPKLVGMTQEVAKPQRLQVGEVNTVLSGLRKELAQREKRQIRIQTRIVLLRDLIDCWLQTVQQEILTAANAEYSAEGLDLETVTRQAQRLIAEVEKRLRVVITKKYKQQFGVSWVQHIESAHKPMFERWSRYMQRDQTVFKVYPQFSTETLEYALFEDLRDLVMAQWHLFHAIFDFGFEGRNRSVFHEKMTQIIHVRNLLAHNRVVPENELLRARVLCTDILLALDRAAEGLE